MTSVTDFNCLPNNTSFGEVLRGLSLFDVWPPAPNGSGHKAASDFLKEALASLPSADLEAVGTVLRIVIGQIDTLLLERQLAECGFDAVRAVPAKEVSGLLSWTAVVDDVTAAFPDC
jgi:hypothetical protein